MNMSCLLVSVLYLAVSCIPEIDFMSCICKSMFNDAQRVVPVHFLKYICQHQELLSFSMIFSITAKLLSSVHRDISWDFLSKDLWNLFTQALI